MRPQRGGSLGTAVRLVFKFMHQSIKNHVARGARARPRDARATRYILHYFGNDCAICSFRFACARNIYMNNSYNQ